MDIALEPGTYVVAVSGGVDSVALLHMLREHGDLRLIVAHFDHGIRADSDIDRKLVQHLAQTYGLQFVYGEGNLGAQASEAVARKARYEFLHKVREAANAKAIITAHHEDDLIETAILNILRGTGRRGLSSLKSTDTIARPLLHLGKADLLAYARSHGLHWREDPTNINTRYLRNYIRHRLMPKLQGSDREQFVNILQQARNVNEELDTHIINHLHLHQALERLDRHKFIMLPHKVSAEIMAAWLRRYGVRQFDKKTIERLVVAAKTYKPGTEADINQQLRMRITKDYLALAGRDR